MIGAILQSDRTLQQGDKQIAIDRRVPLAFDQVGLTNIYNAPNMGCAEAQRFIEELEAEEQESDEDEGEEGFWEHLVTL